MARAKAPKVEDKEDRHVIEFTPLPKRGGGRRPSVVWVERLTPLVARPDEWARVWNAPYGSLTQTAHNLKKGKHAVPTGKWDFAVRHDAELTEEHGKKWGWLYACYHGE